MKKYLKPFVVSMVFAVTSSVCSPLFAAAHNEEVTDEREALKIAAVEALITAPPERAMPLARKVVQGDYSDELKERALFVLSQIDEPEAQEIILSVARSGSGELRTEAVRMIGIGGNREAMAQLSALYAEGDEDLREAVLEAYIIADDEEGAYQAALSATDEESFAQAVEALGVIGAHDKLRQLRSEMTLSGSEVSEALIQAYAIAGDEESLRAMALDSSDPESQLQAMEGLGIVGSDSADDTLVEIFKSSENRRVREAAMEGLLISGNDEKMLELYRASNDPGEKKMLLEYLVMMDSEAVWEIIDQALDGGL